METRRSTATGGQELTPYVLKRLRKDVLFAGWYIERQSRRRSERKPREVFQRPPQRLLRAYTRQTKGLEILLKNGL